MDLTVKLPVFEGPLDLLLHLLEKNKVNIYDIPIVEITDQYLDYVKAMPRQDMDVSSEFLVMAATLLDIKSRMLLPKDEAEEEEEEDPRAELVRRLLEYKMYKCLSYELKDRQMDAGRALFREPDIPEEIRQYEPPVDLEDLLSGLTMGELRAVFQDVVRRQEDKIDPIRSGFGEIEKEEVSLEERMGYLERYAVAHRRFRFRELVGAQGSKMETIVTFLSVLELMRMGKISITQDGIFGEIFIEASQRPHPQE